MKADKNDYTPDEKIRFFDTVLNLNILNKEDPVQEKLRGGYGKVGSA